MGSRFLGKLGFFSKGAADFRDHGDEHIKRQYASASRKKHLISADVNGASPGFCAAKT